MHIPVAVCMCMYVCMYVGLLTYARCFVCTLWHMDVCAVIESYLNTHDALQAKKVGQSDRRPCRSSSSRHGAYESVCITGSESKPLFSTHWRLPIDAHTNIRTRIFCTTTYISMYTYMYIYIYIYIYMYVCMYIYIYTHTLRMSTHFSCQISNSRLHGFPLEMVLLVALAPPFPLSIVLHPVRCHVVLQAAASSTPPAKISAQGLHDTEIPTIIDPSAAKKYPSATGSIIVGITVCLAMVMICLCAYLAVSG
jgi:hypothetical protein